MPVQPDRAEPPVAEFGDPAEDTVGAQLHRHAGSRAHTHTHTHMPEHREPGKQFSVSLRGQPVCVGVQEAALRR